MVLPIKRMIFLFAFGALSAFIANAQEAPKWEIDKAHTSINFSVNHFFSAVPGKFADFEGTIHFDQDNLKGSKVAFTVDINSVNTDNDKRDAHLQSKDFFNAEKYPTMTFESTKFEKKSEDKYMVHGKLTIKDVTKDVVLPMEITGEMEHPMKKGTMILGVAINTTLDRTDYGVGVGDWATTMVVGDEVRINIPMELNRKM